VGSPEQAVEACSVADGVVVGSRVVAEMMATGSAEAVADLVGQFRSALEVGAFA
jgi:tryptophan synthase alpha subunit